MTWAPPTVGGWILATLMWSLAYLGFHYFERAKRLAVEQLQLAVVAKDAQLHGLMAQLQPHFLFNCLNSVRGLIVEDPAKAQATVTQLSTLMRYSLQATQVSTVALATELAMVRTYLALEAVRFEERLRTEIEVGDGLAALPVPVMLVQSLVENGVKHGIERSPAGGTIRISAWQDHGALRIRVENPGRLGASPPSTQIGLANARARLRLLYGPAAALALGDDDRTVTAEVSIPLSGARTGGPAHELAGA
jgi:LytS/YehU family sensor histidine kinase